MQSISHPLFLDEHYRPFVAWEKSCNDCIDVKRIYIDVAEDLVAGILLAQIIYWFLPGKDGCPRIQVKKNDKSWLAKSRQDWFKECRISSKQYDRAIKRLIAKGIVEVELHKFGGVPIHHISVNWSTLKGLIRGTSHSDSRLRL
jgi:hypothetical protein